MEKKYTSLKEFYPYYLTEHQNPTSRVLHFIGTGLVLVVLCLAIAMAQYIWLAAIPVIGYGFAWVGISFLKKISPLPLPIPSTVWHQIFFYFLICCEAKKNFLKDL